MNFSDLLQEVMHTGTQVAHEIEKSVEFKSESMIGPGRGGTSHLSDFHQTLPIERVQ